MKKILLVLLLAFPAFAFAQSEKPRSVTLEEVCQMVEENYSFLGKYDVIESDRKLDIFKSQQNYIPSVNLKANVSYQTEVISFPEMVYDLLGLDRLRKDQYSIALELTQRIWDGGQTKAEKAIANTSADARKKELEVELFNLKQNVTNMYFAVLLVDKAIAQADIHVQYLDKMQKMMQDGFDKGIFSSVDLNELKVSMIEAAQARNELKMRRSTVLSTLSDLSGRDLHDSQFQTPMAIRPAVAADFTARPEYALFEAQKKLADAKLGMLEVGRRPQFALVLQGGYGYPGYDILNDSFHPFALAGIRISWDLNNFFFSRKAKKLVEYGALRNIEMAQNAFEHQMNQQLIQQNNEAARLDGVIADDGEIVELRKAIRISSEDRFDKGIITVTELLEDVNDENIATLNKMIHEMELLKTLYQLKYTMNQ